MVDHLCFADDIILFPSGRAKILKLIMQTLNDYGEISCQIVNGDETHFVIPPNTFDTTREKLNE